MNSPQTEVDARDQEKQAAARVAAELVEAGQIVGLGSGSTAAHFLRFLAERVRRGLKIVGIPTSQATKELAKQLGIPLTTLEYDEWGNPASKPQFDYMLSYSPYDNVTAKPYPAMFVTAGLHDSQVGYAEPGEVELGPWRTLYQLADDANLRYNSCPSLHVAWGVVCVAIFATKAGVWLE